MFLVGEEGRIGEDAGVLCMGGKKVNIGKGFGTCVQSPLVE